MITISHDPAVKSAPWLLTIPQPGRAYDAAIRCVSKPVADMMVSLIGPGRVLQ